MYENGKNRVYFEKLKYEKKMKEYIAIIYVEGSHKKLKVLVKAEGLYEARDKAEKEYPGMVNSITAANSPVDIDRVLE